jgi:4,5-DOPA dioxygenase extradiol
MTRTTAVTMTATTTATMTRRQVLGSAACGAIGLATRSAHAGAAPRASVAFVSHGGPLLAIDPVRGPELHAWGAGLPRPSGVLVMTPHWGTRRLSLGATGPGVAEYDFPRFLASRLPRDLCYESPPSTALAARVEAILGGATMGGDAVERGTRRGLDHTTWMPLRHMFPAADVPVLEIAYPLLLPEPEVFALGRRLAPLRDEGVMVLGSGGMTHNLASVDLDAPSSASVPAWSREFDAWAAERLTARDVDVLIDWRHKAPAADLAHPDDGGHFRVLLFALGVASGSGAASTTPATTFPSGGFDLGLSMRCVEMT